MSAILCEDRFDSPQIVRPLLPGERLPFYSTAELLLGVCHFIPKPVKQIEIIEKPKRERSGYEKAWAARTAQQDQYRAQFLPDIKAMLAQGATNVAILEALHISESLLLRAIDRDKELSALAAARGYFSARSKASSDRFKANEAAIHASMAEHGLVKTARQFRFCTKKLTLLLAEANHAEN